MRNQKKKWLKVRKKEVSTSAKDTKIYKRIASFGIFVSVKRRTLEYRLR